MKLRRELRRLARDLLVAAVRRHTYPSNTGHPIRRDPTLGRIERDLQWRIQDLYRPTNAAERVVLEQRAQAMRDRRRQEATR